MGTARSVVVPPGFAEDVRRAREEGSAGDLELFAAEVRGLPWEREGLRAVARAQLDAGLDEGASVTCEALRALAAAPSGEHAPQGPLRVLVFTGHRVDAPGRPTPRFPADQEPAARSAIRGAVQAELARGPAAGIAGGASGGDILFHEVCTELGVPTRLFLALPPAPYVAESVAPSGARWVERFRALEQRLEKRVLSERKELPSWLSAKRDYDVWQRSNLWTLHHALAAGPRNVTLLALWDGAPAGDGPGGTSHMVREARARGARVEILDTKALFGIG